jgi:hypothetical protein
MNPPYFSSGVRRHGMELLCAVLLYGQNACSHVWTAGRQKPPPEAVHLDLPPPHLCGSPSKFRVDVPGARESQANERPLTASSKKRPIRHKSAGPLRGSRSKDDDTFSARSVNRPLSGFGRPTTRQELEQLMGPLSKSELASAQVCLRGNVFQSI